MSCINVDNDTNQPSLISQDVLSTLHLIRGYLSYIVSLVTESKFDEDLKSGYSFQFCFLHPILCATR